MIEEAETTFELNPWHAFMHTLESIKKLIEVIALEFTKHPVEQL